MNIQDPKFLAQVEQAVREAGQISSMTGPRPAI